MTQIKKSEILDVTAENLVALKNIVNAIIIKIIKKGFKAGIKCGESCFCDTNSCRNTCSEFE